ncbi:DNA repair protein RadC [Variovorax sp. NFACC27]|uniref:JAB domain-containing protein n=1 Tax=Variovorax gossypii TaxID=1679495 RepID=A0A3S0HDL1_9BURK|nr:MULTISPECIES: DNA repair protein RadC [Variovorax]SEF26962.1 DNA replication and repair protein RadC [Variovorax sp. NFACC28]SEG62735.1 DNA replication and repair protein RadC [Variovorax sp. NFACC29]SFC63945.1 DNA replication and repair protein RadC [Variovorax sp. NFACC26]SFG82976.1 DNA replication and repair protein RadC [Variovorax sp. NFACC27]RTQ33458.1 JAB domain-containing protein [Variovorax gossypii]
MSFKDLPLDARPREKLISRGASALADAELLALLLRTGVAGKNVLQLAQQLLERFGGLSGLLHTGAEDLKSVKGMGGSAKRSELIAVLELARRAMGEKLRERAVFDSPDAVKQYLQLHIGTRPYEVFAVVFLDVRHRMIALEEMFRGTLTQTSVYPREVVTRAIHHQAAAVVLAHNHPSGSIEPSRADESLTQTLRAALALVDVRVLDHIIVSTGQSFSMAERGLL